MNNNNTIRDHTGKTIGYTIKVGNGKVYTDSAGKVMGRVFYDRTYNAKGAFKGFGDQGMRFFK
jgi:hypothetical protein